jgi:four helix bundle protein
MTEAEALKLRTRKFALDVILLVRCFPRTIDAEVVGHQLINAGTSVAANYRSACRTRSPADFISKISIVCEESDEAQLWLDVTLASKIAENAEARRLLDEASELTAIATASRNTAKANAAKKKAQSILAMLAILAILAMNTL